jgi:hypothetical protein
VAAIAVPIIASVTIAIGLNLLFWGVRALVLARLLRAPTAV